MLGPLLRSKQTAIDLIGGVLITFCGQKGVSLESSIEPVHLDTLRVAEVVPHLGPPVLGHIGGALRSKYKISPGPWGPIPALLGPVWGVPGPGPGGGGGKI